MKLLVDKMPKWSGECMFKEYMSECRLKKASCDMEKGNKCQYLIAKQTMSDDLIKRKDAIKAFTVNSKGERLPYVDCDNFPIEFSLEYIVKTLIDLPNCGADMREREGE